MYLPAIPEIRVETAGNEVTYWLPARPLGKARWFGALPIGFSVLWVSAVGRMFVEMVRDLSTSKQSGFAYFMAAFLLAFLVVGCAPAAVGCLAMFGRCRVTWRDGRLTVSDSVGLFGWRRRMPRAAIRKFAVVAGATSNGKPVTTGPLAALAMLVAEFEKGKPRVLAMGYPRAWLEAIATDLSGYAARSQPATPQIEFRDARGNPSPLQDAAEQPADSRVVVERQAGRTVLEVPAAGLRKGSVGLFFFSILWCVMAVFTSTLAFGKHAKSAKDFWMVLLFIGGFWAAGLGMMAAAIHLGRRRTTLTAGGGGLTVVQSGPFGVKRREFRRDEIAAIRADASNMEVNGVRLFELQIHRLAARKVGLLAGREAGELRWMATELRAALGVTAKGDE